MTLFITVLHVIVCIFLIIVVLLQRGKGAEVGAMFGGGGSSTMFGARGAGNLFTRLTTVSAAIFMITSLTLATTGRSTDSDLFTAPETEASGFEEAEPAESPFEAVEPAEPGSGFEEVTPETNAAPVEIPEATPAEAPATAPEEAPEAAEAQTTP